jgi:hypothetical protein
LIQPQFLPVPFAKPEERSLSMLLERLQGERLAGEALTDALLPI